MPQLSAATNHPLSRLKSSVRGPVLSLHTITISATDSDGDTGNDSVNITVYDEFIDWARYLNFENGRRWDYLVTYPDGWTSNIYIYVTVGIKNGIDVYVKEWGGDWDYYLDYIKQDFSDGVYMVGFYEDGIETILSSPFKIRDNWIILGQEYTYSGLFTVIYEREDVTVPYGTFTNCLKTIQTNNDSGEISTTWYAEDVGIVKTTKEPEGVLSHPTELTGIGMM